MDRRIAALALVALVALSGCNGVFGGTPTPTATTTGDAGGTTATTATTTTTATNQSGDLPPGIDDDGDLSDPRALVEAHTTALAETGYATSATVRTEDRTQDVAPQILTYDARVAAGGAPFRIDANASVGEELTRHRTIWGNDSVRLQRTRERQGPDNYSVAYDRQARGPPSVDPGIRAFQQVLFAGDYEVTDVTGSGENRRIFLSADGHREEALAGTGINVTDYQGQLTVDSEGRILLAEIHMTYVTARGDELVSHVQYGVDSQDGADVAEPAWVDEALAETDAPVIDATATEDGYIAVTNTGEDPIPADHRIAVASEAGATVLELEEPIPPGGTVYVYQPTGESVTLGREVPTGDVDPLEGAYRIVVLTPDGDQIGDVVVEFD